LHEDQGACEVGGRVERDRPARARGGYGDASQAGADNSAGARGEPEQCVGRLQQFGFDGLRHDGLRGGKEESGRRAADCRERGEVPWRRDAGQEQCCGSALGRGAEQVGTDHDEIPR
jgi:hypothetical protein